MILCKIKNDERTNVVQVDQYSLYSVGSDIVFPTETILRNNGYINGHFQLTYYLLSPWTGSELKVYDSRLAPVKFSKNRTQIRATFSNYPQLTNDNDINIFESYYQANKTQVKLLTFANRKSSVVQHLKFNFFTKQYVLRFSEPTEYTKEDDFYLYTMKFQPIIEEYDLLPLIQEQPIQYIHIKQPKFFDTNLSSKWVTSQSYETLTSFTESEYNIPIAINNALETIYYDVNDTNSFVHFGTYQSRLNAFAQKYIDLLNISQSYVSASKTSKIQQLIEGFNTFQRYCLLDVNLITTGSQNSIKSFSDMTTFNQWYQTKSDSASVCDQNNIHALYKLLPETILYDERNTDLIQFVNILGDTLDEFWAGIRNLTAINSLLQVELQNYSFDYLVQVLKNYGIDYQRGFRIQTLNKIFFQSSLLNRDEIQLNHYNKNLLVRLLANIPFLLKSKGSRHCIQQLYNIFGLSQGLLRIHEFVKDSYNGQNLVRITKPYFSCSSTNTMSFQNSSNAEVALIYARFPIVPTSTELIKLNTDIVSGINYELNKPYLWILEKSGSSVNFQYYVETELSTITSSWPGNNLSTISFVSQCSIDNVKFLRQTMSDYSLYAKGTNIIDSRNNIQAIFDFNSLYPNQLESAQITSFYNESARKIQTFDVIKYSSIFSLGNTPSKFYTVSVSQSIQLPKLTIASAIKNYPNIHFGSIYSEYYDSQFIIDYQNQFENLLDNNEYIDFKKLYKYKNLEDYKLLYNNYFSVFTTSYTQMVKFYENLDSSFFKILQQFIPYSLNAKYGVILNNNILTRNKIPTMELVNVKPTGTPSYIIELPASIAMDKVKSPLANIQFTPNFEATNGISVLIELESRPELKGNTYQSSNGLIEINYTGISGVKNNYGSAEIRTGLDQIWRISGSYNTKRSRYYATSSTIRLVYYKIRSFMGSIETSSVSKQRKMIIDQDKNLMITKINI